ncbi:acyltransferase domain-containing protein [Streptomyces sp. M19]
MAAVTAPADEVTAALEETGHAGTVVVANRNSPRQTVISGPTQDVAAAVERLRARGLEAKRIPVACAFHSPWSPPRATPSPRPSPRCRWRHRPSRCGPTAPPRSTRHRRGIRAELAAQIGSPVRFVEQIEAMYEAGARTFVEAGPGAVLTRQVTEILGDRPHRTVTLEARRRTGLPGFLTALAELAVAGTDVRTGWLFQGRDAVDFAHAPAAGARAGPSTATSSAPPTASSPPQHCTPPSASRRPL